MHHMRLVAGFRPDPMGELTALKLSPTWINGGTRRRRRTGMDGVEGKERAEGKENREEWGREERSTHEPHCEIPCTLMIWSSSQLIGAATT